MAYRTCWSCQVLAHQEPVAYSGVCTTYHSPNGEMRSLLQAAFSCDQCQRYSIAWARPLEDGYRRESEDIIREMHELPLTWAPEHAVGQDFPNVPADVAGAADEAHRCFSIAAYRAVGALARAVVEATAKAQGITNGTLMSKIDELDAQLLVTPHVARAAHEVRHLGNEMAHGDFADPLDREDAEAVLGLMDEILDDVFQSPARVDALKKKRLAKKQEHG